jgi:hypothetical protein
MYSYKKPHFNQVLLHKSFPCLYKLWVGLYDFAYREQGGIPSWKKIE